MCLYICIHVYCRCNPQTRANELQEIWRQMPWGEKRHEGCGCGDRYIYVYIFKDIHMWICIHIGFCMYFSLSLSLSLSLYICVYIFVYVDVHAYTNKQIYKYVYMYICLQMFIYVCIYINICNHLYVYTYLHLYIYIYIYIYPYTYEYIKEPPRCIWRAGSRETSRSIKRKCSFTLTFRYMLSYTRLFKISFLHESSLSWGHRYTHTDTPLYNSYTHQQLVYTHAHTLIQTSTHTHSYAHTAF